MSPPNLGRYGLSEHTRRSDQRTTRCPDVAQGRRLGRCSKVVSCQGYTGGDADILAATAPDPERNRLGKRVVLDNAHTVRSSTEETIAVSMLHKAYAFD
jgi:hypothetical protein